MPGIVLVAGEMVENPERKYRQSEVPWREGGGEGERKGSRMQERMLWKEVAETGVQGCGE